MIEIAKLDNGELIYGTYEECEAYADKVESWVIKYFDHVNPSTVYNKFKWVGTGLHNPFAVSVPFDYRKNNVEIKKLNKKIARGVDQDKW